MVTVQYATPTPQHETQIDIDQLTQTDRQTDLCSGAIKDALSASDVTRHLTTNNRVRLFTAGRKQLGLAL